MGYLPALGTDITTPEVIVPRFTVGLAHSSTQFKQGQTKIRLYTLFFRAEKKEGEKGWTGDGHHLFLWLIRPR